MWSAVAKASGLFFSQSHPVSKYHVLIINWSMIIQSCLSCFPVSRCHLSLMGAFYSLCPPTKKEGREELGGFPVGLVVKNPLANARDIGEVGLILGLGRSPGEGNGYSLQYCCLGNSMDRGGWWAAVMGWQSLMWLSDWAHTQDSILEIYT